MSKPIIIIGAGNHARVLLDILLDQKAEVIGLVDKMIPKGEIIYGFPVIGNDNAVFDYSPKEVELINGIGSVDNTVLRKKVFMFFKNHGYSFKNVIHSSAIVSCHAILQEGCQILSGSVVGTEAQIGEDSIINTNTSIDHGCIIGAHVHIAPGCTLCGCVTVGDETHIGTGCSVIQGIIIGKNVLIGAGSTVINNIKDCLVAFGTPARIKNQGGQRYVKMLINNPSPQRMVEVVA